MHNGARALTSVFVAAAIVLRRRGEHLALKGKAQEDCAIGVLRSELVTPSGIGLLR